MSDANDKADDKKKAKKVDVKDLDATKDPKGGPIFMQRDAGFLVPAVNPNPAGNIAAGGGGGAG